jgi:outer membrane immunogenic protein
MKKIALAAAAVSILFTGAASAADMAVKARPMVAPVVIYDWTGFYIGGNVGYGWGREDVTLGPTPNAASLAFFAGTFPTFIPFSVSPRPQGVIGGGQAGYNWQSGRVVFGVEGDIQGADVKGTFNTSVLPGPIQSSTSQGRGRVGITAVDTLLLYVTGGVAFGSVNHFFSAINNAGSFNTTNVTQTNAGWTAGAGFEWGFAPRWSVKAEYLYIDLGTRTFSTIGSGTTPVGASLDSRFADKFHIARVGLNYRFGGPVVARY